MQDAPQPARTPAPCEQYTADVQACLTAGDYQQADELLANLGIPAAERAEMLRAMQRDI
jgi:hypothetical protein